MTKKIIFSGFGGQGVLSSGFLFAEACVKEGYNVTYFPSYGAEMRGGTANCHVIVSTERIASPIITETDILVALNEPSLNKFFTKVKKEGLIFINTSVIKKKIENLFYRIFGFPLDELSLKKLGSSKFANIIQLGVLSKLTDIVKENSLMEAIVNKFGSKGDKIVELNLKALEIGYGLV